MCSRVLHCHSKLSLSTHLSYLASAQRSQNLILYSFEVNYPCYLKEQKVYSTGRLVTLKYSDLLHYFWIAEYLKHSKKQNKLFSQISILFCSIGVQNICDVDICDSVKSKMYTLYRASLVSEKSLSRPGYSNGDIKGAIRYQNWKFEVE